MTDIYPMLAQIKVCKDDDKLLDLIGSLSLALVENNYPYVPRVIAQVKRVNEEMNGSGVVHLELKMYNGKIIEGVFHEITKVKF